MARSACIPFIFIQPKVNIVPRARVVTPREITAASQPPKPGAWRLSFFSALFWARTLRRCSRLARFSASAASRFATLASILAARASLLRSMRASFDSCFNISRRSRLFSMRSCLACLNAAILSRRFCFAASLFSRRFCFFSARIFAASSLFCSRACFLFNFFSLTALTCFFLAVLAGLTDFSFLTLFSLFTLFCFLGEEEERLTVVFFAVDFFAGLLRVRLSAFSVPLEVTFLFI